MFVRTLPIIALAVGACAKAPAEAPAEVADLSAFLFAHFDDEDPAEIEAGLLNMQEYLVTVDMAADAEDRALTLPPLQGSDVAAITIPAGIDPEVQTPVAVPGTSKHAPFDTAPTATATNQVCIESSSTIWAGRELLVGGDCFEDGTCDRLDTITEVRKENPIAKIWYDMNKDYRAFEFEDADGELHQGVIGRAWIPKQFEGDGGNNSWDQLYQLDLAVSDPGGSGSLRYFALWSSVTLSLVSDDAYANLVRDGIDDAFLYTDEFIDGVQEACPNDRDLPKPDRE